MVALELDREHAAGGVRDVSDAAGPEREPAAVPEAVDGERGRLPQVMS